MPPTFYRDQMHFSPNGKWIAYNSDISGVHEVYITRFPNMTATMQVSRGGGVQPLWRNDGRELFYLALDGKLMSVEIKSGEKIDTSSPNMLFTTTLDQADMAVNQYGVSSDGQRFYFLDPHTSAKDTLHVIMRWDAGMPP